MQKIMFPFIEITKCLSLLKANLGIYIFNKNLSFDIVLISLLLSTCISCRDINAVSDPHFTEDGHSRVSIKDSFIVEKPSALGFFVEVSGSMNGFFRSNKATRFKKDVWSIVSYFGGNDVSILSNAGTVAGTYSVNDFRARMNSGAFVSNQETLVPTMLKSILDNLRFDEGQCAVLISDMKYSPEKQKDVKVLLTQYQTDIRNVIGKFPGLAVSLIMAKSDFLAANGSTLTEDSPYYFLILGKDKNVAFMRNSIATLLEDYGDYGDCIETGFDYKAPIYSFGIPDNALQFVDQPTFTNFDVQYSDTCKVVLNIDLSNFRWLITNEDAFKESLAVKSCYGSSVSIGRVSIDVNNHFNKELKRKATAKVELKIYNMFTESDVIEWTLNHPDYSVTLDFTNIMSATAENDYTGSFAVDRFVSGVFNAIQNHWDETPNRILISKIKQ